ncbi:hypothetical protein [Cytobacillus oceanisediminis]|uniref:hypothetical protein n=1 Tax=Cytobacillus oceanisediminis TaxID=665099 RepID=UPI0037370284
MDLVYDFIGALIATWIIYNLFHVILFKFLDKKNLKYISFIGAAILILSITGVTMGFTIGFVLYLPALFLWLVLDLVKLNKMKIAEEKVSG